MALKGAMIVLGVFLLAAAAGAEETVLKTQKDVHSYAIGVETLRGFNRQGLNYDLAIVMQGMKDAAAGGPLLMSDRVITQTVDAVATNARRKHREARLIAQQENKKKGEAFLAENRKKEGVVALPSGLQYTILTAGEGRKPSEADTVECRYRATHIDGTEFDNSERTGAPMTFKVSEVIAGWREALKLMPVGSKWRLFVPSLLAYVQRGSGPIGPYETIIYELELVAIK